MKGKLGRPPLESAKRRENKVLVRLEDFVNNEFTKEAEKHGIPPCDAGRNGSQEIYRKSYVHFYRITSGENLPLNDEQGREMPENNLKDTQKKQHFLSWENFTFREKCLLLAYAVFLRLRSGFQNLKNRLWVL